jgi:dipeptidyl aminopeptidase/acylaminoacyl peptidase
MSSHPGFSGTRQGVIILSFFALLLSIALPLGAQERTRREVQMDTARARALYVSNRWEDHPDADYNAQIVRKMVTDSLYAAVTQGVVDYQKITYRSSIGDMDIPAYVFQPLEKRGPGGHAAMIWVHGGVHGDLSANYWPFIREAVERGYVIVAPEYRGSTGYGRFHYRAIDYGGYEVDDCMTAYDWMVENLPHVDPNRVGFMGWSHGGLITIHAVTRKDTPFQAGAAIVPVTNLLFRLSLKGPGYQRRFATQQRLGGLPFEEEEKYYERSPYYIVDSLKTPLLVHVATNDEDVDFEEGEPLIYKLRDMYPTLTETRIYIDPEPWGRSVGHSFSRRVDSETLERVDSPSQIDSWNRVWAFFDWHLRPYQTEPIPRTHQAR